MSTIDSYTAEQKRKIVIAYFASGNSVEDLVDQLVSALHPGDINAYGLEFDDIVKEMHEARVGHDASTASVEEECKMLLDDYHKHLEYSVNSPIIG